MGLRYATEADAAAALAQLGIELDVALTGPRRLLAPRRHLEDEAQRALIAWRETVVTREPRLALLYHIPNGGKRNAATAGWLKAMGVKPGMPDNHLPVAARGFHSCYCELKIGRRQPSEAQRDILAALTLLGHCAGVYWGWATIAAHLCWYLERPDLCPEGVPYGPET